MMLVSKTNESVLDRPKEGLDPAVWQNASEDQKPILTPEAQTKIDQIVAWAQNQYGDVFKDTLSVYIIGSICSNSWSEKSDIDIDFCAINATEDDSDEDVVKEFGWAFKKNFIENYAEARPEDAKIGSHPFEVYFNPNPFQCFMSVGCYNVLEKKWEVGPELKSTGFDPISEYYEAAMKQVDRILKDVRDKIFSLYEKSLVASKSIDEKFRDQQWKEIQKLLSEAAELLKLMKKVRSNYQKPAKSKEEALKRRKDKKQMIVDAAFKFLEKFGYIQILKDLSQIYDDFETGEDLSQESTFNLIIDIVKRNISIKQLEDSEDQEFVQKLIQEDQLEESVKDLVRVSVIASLMAISNLLPANALAKELTNANKEAAAQGIKLTKDSPLAKEAIANASRDSQDVGGMSKTNVVNALSRVLWKEARGEGKTGIDAIASVILNRAGEDPEKFIKVISKPEQFSCLKSYNGGWNDKTYSWFNPPVNQLTTPEAKEIWEYCKSDALKLVEKKFKSTIGNRNSYMNKATASEKAKKSWGWKLDLKIGKHTFGYLRDQDPKRSKIKAKTKNRSEKTAVNPKFAVAKKGDTLSKIAKDNKTDVASIMKLNPGIKDPKSIQIGQKIRIA